LRPSLRRVRAIQSAESIVAARREALNFILTRSRKQCTLTGT
jgi:hypothetical protein